MILQVWHGTYDGGGENRTLGSNSGCTRPSSQGLLGSSDRGSDSLAASNSDGIPFFIP
jgi:hypothetical protein